MTRFGICCMAGVIALCLCGCASGDTGDAAADIVSEQNATLICEDSISPNRDFVQSEADKVTYCVQVYQDADNKIIVTTDSNSAFSKAQHYEVECDRKISESDVAVTWTTLMGSLEYTEDDQLAIADVAIVVDGSLFSERKINFVSGAVEIVSDVIEQTAK